MRDVWELGDRDSGFTESLGRLKPTALASKLELLSLRVSNRQVDRAMAPGLQEMGTQPRLTTLGKPHHQLHFLPGLGIQPVRGHRLGQLS